MILERGVGAYSSDFLTQPTSRTAQTRHARSLGAVKYHMLPEGPRRDFFKTKSQRVLGLASLALVGSLHDCHLPICAIISKVASGVGDGCKVKGIAHLRRQDES